MIKTILNVLRNNSYSPITITKKVLFRIQIYYAKKTSKVNFIFLPLFNREDEFSDQYYRMIWYLNPIVRHIKRVYIPSSVETSKNKKLARYLDKEIQRFEHKFIGKIEEYSTNNVRKWKKYLRKSHIVMTWKQDYQFDNKSIGKEISNALKIKKNYKIDRHKNRFEGSLYLRVSHDLNPNFKKDLRRSREKFTEMARALGSTQKGKGYVFGTGPSLKDAFNFNFSDGTSIICNSIVKNRELLAHVKPRVVVFADPIFHAGCSSYAGQFRSHLVDVMKTYDVFFIVPFRDYKLYIENLPSECEPKIIGIPMEVGEKPNFHLKEEFHVTLTSNILTLFLLPIAGTFCKEVGILGCDGRKIEDNQYFWDHHKESQINEEMEEIKRAHPAFFKIDYDDYYLTHTSILEKWLDTGESNGIRFISMTNSYIPALEKRRN